LFGALRAARICFAPNAEKHDKPDTFLIAVIQDEAHRASRGTKTRHRAECRFRTAGE
jgi:hypothetical protein